MALTAERMQEAVGWHAPILIDQEAWQRAADGAATAGTDLSAGPAPSLGSTTLSTSARSSASRHG